MRVQRPQRLQRVRAVDQRAEEAQLGVPPRFLKAIAAQPEASPMPGSTGQRNTRTGILLWVSTLLVSLPMTSALTPRRPCEA